MNQEDALRFFTYSNGKLYCKEKTTNKSNKSIVGQEIGHLNASGYLITKINYKQYFVHKIIFLMHHGYMPKVVDHIDRNKTNNSIKNLRAATISENQHNRDRSKNNTSGYKNISWCKRTNKWQVSVMANKKQIHFGRFDDIELADLVAQEARDKYHKSFALNKLC